MSGSFDFDVVELYVPSNHMGALEATSTLKLTGWNGGLWVRYAAVTSVQDGSSIRTTRTVEPAGPTDPIGFILRGSLEATDLYTSQNPGKTGPLTVGVGGQFLFKYYETKNKAERTIPGSGALLVYVLNQNLYVSSNGLLTNENEGSARTVGICSGLPAQNNSYIGADILFP